MSIEKAVVVIAHQIDVVQGLCQYRDVVGLQNKSFIRRKICQYRDFYDDIFSVQQHIQVHTSYINGKNINKFSKNF